MCMQHFFIKVEEVITSQGNENRRHLGNKLLLKSYKENLKEHKTTKKCNQRANNNEKITYIFVTTNNFQNKHILK